MIMCEAGTYNNNNNNNNFILVTWVYTLPANTTAYKSWQYSFELHFKNIYYKEVWQFFRLGSAWWQWTFPHQIVLQRSLDGGSSGAEGGPWPLPELDTPHRNAVCLPPAMCCMTCISSLLLGGQCTYQFQFVFHIYLNWKFIWLFSGV